jgi:hypothetical protein
VINYAYASTKPYSARLSALHFLESYQWSGVFHHKYGRASYQVGKSGKRVGDKMALLLHSG